MSELQTKGPKDPTCPDRWILRSGEDWQEYTGEAVLFGVRSVLGETAVLAWTLEQAIELRDQLTQHIQAVTPTPVPKTREEMAAFVKDWDAMVDADRAKRVNP